MKPRRHAVLLAVHRRRQRIDGWLGQQRSGAAGGLRHELLLGLNNVEVLLRSGGGQLAPGGRVRAALHGARLGHAPQQLRVVARELARGVAHNVDAVRAASRRARRRPAAPRQRRLAAD